VSSVEVRTMDPDARRCANHETTSLDTIRAMRMARDSVITVGKDHTVIKVGGMLNIIVLHYWCLVYLQESVEYNVCRMVPVYRKYISTEVVLRRSNVSQSV